MEDSNLKFLIEECSFTKERALEILKGFEEMCNIAKKQDIN